MGKMERKTDRQRGRKREKERKKDVHFFLFEKYNNPRGVLILPVRKSCPGLSPVT